MRRLLVSVAFLAALLIAPSAALALDPPANAAAPAATNRSLPVVTWTDRASRDHLQRLPRRCGLRHCTRRSLRHRSDRSRPGIGSFTDTTVTLQGSYCYFVEADDGSSAPRTRATPGHLTTPRRRSSPVVDIDRRQWVRAVHGDQRDGDRQPRAGHAVGQRPPFAVHAARQRRTVRAGEFEHYRDGCGRKRGDRRCPSRGTSCDPDRPPAPRLEITTDPGPAEGDAQLGLRHGCRRAGDGLSRARQGAAGPERPERSPPDATSLVFGNLQVDATYEYSLSAKDACGESAPSVRLVRLNDTSPPTVPIVAQPAFNRGDEGSVALVGPEQRQHPDRPLPDPSQRGTAGCHRYERLHRHRHGPAPGHLAELRGARRRHQRQHHEFRRQDREGSRLEPAHAAGRERRSRTARP